MNSGLVLLCLNSAAVALMHTLLGPDHYVPFVAMARARNWTIWRTSVVTTLCGIGHVGSAVVLGLTGIAGWIELKRLAHIETVRGSLATWALIVFGAVYFAWGLRRAARAPISGHAHQHAHGGGHGHSHEHEHAHRPDRARPVSITPWVLFTVFVLGPCEPAVPLIMYPAASDNWTGVVLVALVFGAVTLVTMLAVVLGSLRGLQQVHWPAAERHVHALAGATILLTGCALKVFAL